MMDAIITPHDDDDDVCGQKKGGVCCRQNMLHSSQYLIALLAFERDVDDVFHTLLTLDKLKLNCDASDEAVFFRFLQALILVSLNTQQDVRESKKERKKNCRN